MKKAKPTKKKKKLEQKVLCFACSQPIHIDEFGGVFMDGGKRFVHNNIVCLMKLPTFQEHRNKSLESAEMR